MNAQRLVTLSKLIRDEIRSGSLPSNLKELTSRVKQAIDGPNESNQRQVEESISQLTRHLQGVESNQLSPGLRGDLHEFRIDEVPVTDLIGQGLLRQLETIFENGYTSVHALDSVKRLQQLVSRLDTSLGQLTDGLGGLSLPAEDLEEGESVVGMTVPRSEVRDGMRALIKELLFLDRFMLELSECVDGQAHDPQVYSLRSSDFGIDLGTGLTVAGLFAAIVNGVKSTLETINEYRKLKADAERLGVVETVEAIDRRSNEAMEAAVDDIQAEVFSHCKVNNEGRVNELKTAIKFKINGLANRMERGFTFEVRTALPPGADMEAIAMNERVTALSKVTFTPISGPKMLALPEGDDDEQAEAPAAEKKPRKAKHKA